MQTYMHKAHSGSNDSYLFTKKNIIHSTSLQIQNTVLPTIIGYAISPVMNSNVLIIDQSQLICGWNQTCLRHFLSVGLFSKLSAWRQKLLIYSMNCFFPVLYLQKSFYHICKLTFIYLDSKNLQQLKFCSFLQTLLLSLIEYTLIYIQALESITKSISNNKQQWSSWWGN